MPASIRRYPPATAGVLTIVATVFAMALADAVVKYASADMTLWQLYVLRSALVVPVLLGAARGRIRCPRLGWVVLRSLSLVLMYLSIYAAIPLLPLSVIAASLYTGPLFIVALSALVLREPITLRHGAAILIGFAGVLLIVQPAAAGFRPLALIPVGAALLYALAAVVTRARCRAVATPTLALWLNLMLLLTGAAASLWLGYTDIGRPTGYAFLFGRWQPMTGKDWQVIVVLALLMVGISLGLARAYQSPRPQVVATFDYAFLIFAAFWGFVFFGEVPNGLTLAGIGLIAAAGIIVLHAETPVNDAPVRRSRHRRRPGHGDDSQTPW